MLPKTCLSVYPSHKLTISQTPELRALATCVDVSVFLPSSLTSWVNRFLPTSNDLGLIACLDSLANELPRAHTCGPGTGILSQLSVSYTLMCTCNHGVPRQQSLWLHMQTICLALHAKIFGQQTSQSRQVFRSGVVGVDEQTLTCEGGLHTAGLDGSLS